MENEKRQATPMEALQMLSDATQPGVQLNRQNYIAIEGCLAIIAERLKYADTIEQNKNASSTTVDKPAGEAAPYSLPEA